jgi:hypothetical protein
MIERIHSSSEEGDDATVALSGMDHESRWIPEKSPFGSKKGTGGPIGSLSLNATIDARK